MSEALRLAEEDERTSGILRTQPRYAPELRRLQAESVELRKDAERYRWLRERYTAVNFDWEESGQQAVIFTADDFPIATASCDETIDAAISAAKEQTP